MDSITLTLTAMANGGAAFGRGDDSRVVFVPQAIPGERVRVEIVEDKKRYARGRLVEILESSPERVEPPCPHFGPCGGCHFQHIADPAQLRFKEEVIRDQLSRLAGLTEANVQPVLANPEPWAYGIEANLYPAPEGKLGFWSPDLGRVMPVETCLVMKPRLLELFQDTDLLLPNLRKMTLRIGSDGGLLAALEVDGVEPPSLETDFPVSVALVLPDNTAANLVGENYLLQSVNEHDFRVSAGCFFYPSLQAAEQLVDVVLGYATLDRQDKVLELFSGVGTLTAFLASAAAEVVGIESNPDAVADAAVNLNGYDNVTLYEGRVETILPLLDVTPDVVIAHPPAAGLAPLIVDEIGHFGPDRFVYVSSDVATMARDSRRLTTAGYRLVELQPIDMLPQNFQTQTVSLWAPA